MSKSKNLFILLNSKTYGKAYDFIDSEYRAARRYNI